MRYIRENITERTHIHTINYLLVLHLMDSKERTFIVLHR